MNGPSSSFSSSFADTVTSFGLLLWIILYYFEGFHVNPSFPCVGDVSHPSHGLTCGMSGVVIRKVLQRAAISHGD